MNSAEVVFQFLEFMRGHSIVPRDPSVVRPAGKLIRFEIEGDAPKSKNGWFRLHDDFPPNGVVGNWKTGQEEKWKPDIKPDRPWSETEREDYRRRVEARRAAEVAEIEANRKEAAKVSQIIWASNKDNAASPHHPYLVRKNVRPHNLREINGTLLVPVIKHKQIIGIQFIDQDGKKRFKFGTDIAGAFYTFGRPEREVIICEGWATGATIFEATGTPVVVAFQANNLLAVARTIKERLGPNSLLTIAADNDAWTKKPVDNPGVHYAREAALAVGAEIRIPQFKPGFEGKPTDFNDLAELHGIYELTYQIINGEPTWKNEAAQAPAPSTTVMQLPAELLGDNKKNSALHSDFFASVLRERLLFDDFSSSWYSYDKVWRPVTEGDADRALVKLFDRAYQFNYGSRWFGDVKKILKVRLGRSPIMNPSTNEVSDTWNAERQLLPMANGVLNIYSGELTPHRPDMMFNWFVPYDYCPEAKCPNIDDFLKTLSQDDPDLERLSLAYLWAILHGRSDLQKYLELIGKPGTGKSTYLHIATKLVGAENTAVTTMSTLHENRFETASLYGKRLVVITDADKWAGSIDTFKAVTGQDPIRYEVKGKQQGRPFVFGGMLLVAANNAIRSTDSSTALMRRRMTIYIDKLLAKEKMQDRYLERVIDPEIPGLLNRLMRMDETETLRTIRTFEKTRERSLIETDTVAAWLDERCEFVPEARAKIGSLRGGVETEQVARSQLYPNFVAYLSENGIRQNVTLQDFSSRVIEISMQLGHNVHKHVFNNGAHLMNVRLKANIQEMLNI